MMEKISKKSLLYKSGVEYADFCINHVTGCAHGCRYPCYAMMMAKRFGKIKDYNDWIKPKIVGNAMELLNKEIPKYKSQIKLVHLSFSTDPFMYRHVEVRDLTLKIIARLAVDQIRCSVLTKGVYPKNLTDIGKYGSRNAYGITLVSLVEDFRKRFEPYSAPFNERIAGLKHLSKKGLETWISMEPYPTPNLVNQNLSEILEKISFVDKIIFGKLNYNVKTSEFNGTPDFYENCANQVIRFCRKNNISYHIKYGTQSKNDKSTESVLRENVGTLAEAC